jgi:hypothetical protein
MKRRRQSLLTVRAPRNSEQGCRIRQLYRQFISKLDRNNPEHQAMALTASELTVAAEAMRSRLLAGDITAEGPTVRLENSARRARADLRGKAELKAEEEADDWGAIQDEADRIAEERRKQRNEEANSQAA